MATLPPAATGRLRKVIQKMKDEEGLQDDSGRRALAARCEESEWLLREQSARAAAGADRILALEAESGARVRVGVALFPPHDGAYARVRTRTVRYSMQIPF